MTVRTSTTRKTTTSDESAPEVAVEETTVVEEDAAPVLETFSRWFPVACACGGQVISDDPEELGTVIEHAAHLTRLGQAAPPAEHTYEAGEGSDLAPIKVTPKDGKVTITVEQLEQLTAAAGLSKVEPGA